MTKELEKMIWSNVLSIGNDLIDKDHKRLFDIYNKLVDLVELDQNREEFAKILSEMTDYARTHFAKEEKYMKAFSYPEITNHIKSHREYIRQVAMYNSLFTSPNPPDPFEIIVFLKTWWANHILYRDMEYEKYRKSEQPNTNYD